jgi:RNA polymerase sigma-70 factor (ECF subfamily)
MPMLMPEDPEFIKDFLDQWQAGIDREENFCRLFERYYHRVHRFFLTRGFLADECDDLTQETFFCIYTGLETFRREAQFEAWLFQIAANMYRQSLRRQSAAKRGGTRAAWESANDLPEAAFGEDELDAVWSGPGPLDEVLAEERRRVLCEAIEELPEPMRQCMALRVYQELSYREIAGMMEISVGTVKSYMIQAQQQLKVKLAEYFGE